MASASVKSLAWTGRRTLDQLRSAAERSPDAIAIEHAGRTITYAELMESASRIAEALREVGVEEGLLVGHCFERTAESIVALLGILEAGAGYVPVDPRYPQGPRLVHADGCGRRARPHGSRRGPRDRGARTPHASRGGDDARG